MWKKQIRISLSWFDNFLYLRFCLCVCVFVSEWCIEKEMKSCFLFLSLLSNLSFSLKGKTYILNFLLFSFFLSFVAFYYSLLSVMLQQHEWEECFILVLDKSLFPVFFGISTGKPGNFDFVWFSIFNPIFSFVFSGVETYLYLSLCIYSIML